MTLDLAALNLSRFDPTTTLTSRRKAAGVPAQIAEGQVLRMENNSTTSAVVEVSMQQHRHQGISVRMTQLHPDQARPASVLAM